MVLSIIGTLQALKLSQYGKKVSGLITVAVAASLGLLAGFGHIEGLGIVSGLLSGLAAIGAVTTIDRLKK